MPGSRWIVPLLLVCASAASAESQGAGLLIRNVRLFDGERVLPRTSVIVADGRIVAVSLDATPPPGAEVIEGEGRTLLPGLIDAHAHVRGSALTEEIVFGVTTALDMSTDVDWAAARRKEQAAGLGLDRADLYSAGELITAPGGHGTEYVNLPAVSSPGEAQAAVDRRIADGSDYIKVVLDDNRTFGKPIPTLDAATLKAVVEAAHARHRMAVVHIGSVEGARVAIESGADGLAHLSPDRVVDDAFVALVKARGAFVVPTLDLNESFCGTPSGASLVTDPHLAPFLSPFSERNLTKSYSLHPDVPIDFQRTLISVARLHAAGVAILAGTDSPVRGTATGVSIHRELELLVKAGLSATEALAAATSAPAKAFSLSDRGRIAAGYRADLLLVEGDPTENILSTRNIVSVWKLGHKADRDAFRAEQQQLRLQQRLVSIARGIGIAAFVGLLLFFSRRSRSGVARPQRGP